MSQATSALSGGAYTNRRYVGAWNWTSGQLGRSFVLSQYSRDDGPIATSTVRGACNVLTLEANGLT